jgi:hypothetical protein
MSLKFYLRHHPKVRLILTTTEKRFYSEVEVKLQLVPPRLLVFKRLRTLKSRHPAIVLLETEVGFSTLILREIDGQRENTLLK